MLASSIFEFAALVTVQKKEAAIEWKFCVCWWYNIDSDDGEEDKKYRIIYY